MNIITLIKHRLIIITLILLYSFIAFPLCSCQSESEYSYPLIETEYDVDIFLPKYVPDNYKFKEINISPLFISVTYTSTYGDLYYTQIPSSNNTLSLDTENNTITEYTSNKFTGYLLTNTVVDSLYLLSVYNDTGSYEISGIIEKEELLKMIESISPYEP